MRYKVLAALLSSLALVGALAGVSFAAGPNTSGAAGTSANTQPAVNPAYRAIVLDKSATSSGNAATSNSAAAAPTCWTAFAPPAPQGIEMYQYYRNCNGYTLSVFPGYQDSSGIHALGSCVSVTNGAHKFWYYASTIMNVSYGTYVC
ncbi:hypothetical protein [Kutzneria sp. NPDC051319]|uniref:hypothetical protein n=1 Tax=Kutzneria sp. NPDC051319 TaxID=3155047 RepID=UPI0034135AEB